MDTTGILGALRSEIALLEEKLKNRKKQKILGIEFIIGEIGDRRVALARTGIGKVNAAMIATLLLEHFNPSEVIFTGVAGRVNPDLLPGDIVIAEKTAQHDLGHLTPDGFQTQGVKNPINRKRNPVFFPADVRLLKLAETSAKRVEFEKIRTDKIKRLPKITKGIIVTGDVFTSSPSKKIELRSNLQADAVEMEGAAVAQICWQQGVPCLVIRCLCDMADKNIIRHIMKFYKIAACNSARLVVDIIEQLAWK